MCIDAALESSNADKSRFHLIPTLIRTSQLPNHAPTAAAGVWPKRICTCNGRLGALAARVGSDVNPAQR